MEEEIKSSSARVSDMIPRLVEGMRNLSEQRSSQMEFVKICEHFVGPAQELASISRSIVGTLKSESTAIQLSNTSRDLGEAVSVMKTSIDKAQQSCEFSGELDVAIDTVKNLIQQVHEYKLEANRAQLRPLPGETSDQCIRQMNAQCKLVNERMSELLNAGSSNNEQSIIDSARELSSALRTLLSSVRGVAATTQNDDLKMRILDNTKSVLLKTIGLFEETKWTLSGSFTDVERNRRLSSASQHIQHALNSCIFCLPLQKDIDECVRSILELSEKYNENNLPNSQTNRPYGELHTNLQISANRLLEQAANILEPATYTDQSLLVQTTKQYSNCYKDLYNSGIKLASSTNASSQNSSSQQVSRILASLRQIASNSSKLLIASKNASSDQQNPQARNALHTACKLVTDSVNDLLSQSVLLDNQTSTECDNSLRRIQSSCLTLNNVQQPINNTSYFNCLEQITRLSTLLNDQLSNLNNSLNDPQCVNLIKTSTSCICDLIERTAHSAYLIGASDPTSIAGKAALVNIEELQYANDQIEQACKQLTSRQNEKKDIINAATKIAKYTSELCNAGKNASTNVRTNNYDPQSQMNSANLSEYFFLLNALQFNN